MSEAEANDLGLVPIDDERRAQLIAETLEAAEANLRLAKFYGGKEELGVLEYLSLNATLDTTLDHPEPHEASTCGLCYNLLLKATVAREMIAAGNADAEPIEAVVKKHAAEVKQRWEDSKFVKLWQEEKAAGRDPHAAFKARGWEP